MLASVHQDAMHLCIKMQCDPEIASSGTLCGMACAVAVITAGRHVDRCMATVTPPDEDLGVGARRLSLLLYEMLSVIKRRVLARPGSR